MRIRRRRRRLLALAAPLALVLLAGLWLWHGLWTHVASAGATAGGSGTTAADSFVPDLGLPATGVVAFGASPQESAGEIWSYGVLGATPATVDGHAYSDQFVLLQRDSGSADWRIVPLPANSEGKPLTGTQESEGPPLYGALAGQATADGGVVLLAGQHAVIRNPGGSPTLVPQPSGIVEGGSPPGGEAGVLEPGESLLPPRGSGSSLTVPYAAIEEEGAPSTGLLIAPYHDGQSAPASNETPFGVLRYAEHEAKGEWTREPIAVPAGARGAFLPEAIACGGAAVDPQGSSPRDCWLLASYSVGAGVQRLALFRRTSGGKAPGWSWQPQPVSDWMLGEAPAPAGVSSASAAPLAQGGQMLTATSQGVWVDFQASVNGEAAATDVSELVLDPPGEGGASSPSAVAGRWCFPTSKKVCEDSLGAYLPARYRSFAWPGSSPSDAGTRVITGLPNRAMLELAGGSFRYEAGAGGETGLDGGGAALYRQSPESAVEGWIADGVFREDDGADGEGQSQAVELLPAGAGQSADTSDQLQAETVPFRHPLLALAQAPGGASGDPGAEAVAVGLQGQIGRYAPGQGWRPESLYNSAGIAQTPTLRGVAWPEAGRIYAVGDNGAMWLWRAETGLWESDPAKPFNFIGNLTAVAFDPGEPQLGYAVGKQGVLLKYGKSWEQVPLPAELQQANFTSIAFAGGEALATYRTLATEKDGSVIETGGLAVEEAGDGAHWHVDTHTAQLLAQLPSPRDALLSKVAGLPDGGAVAGGPGLVIEREASGSEWHLAPTPLPEAQNVSAIAAYRELGGPVRALVSVELDRALNPGQADGNLQHGPFDGDVPPATGAGQPPAFLPPDPLPDTGYLLKETADGWVDMEHQALPVKQGGNDLPVRPDPVLALLASESGTKGLAVGGQTYDGGGRGAQEAAETAAALRFPMAAGGPNGTASAAVETHAGANFVVAGRAACGGACASLENEGIGPDVWLTHALQMASRIGAAGFLYTGGRLPDSATLSPGVGGEGLSSEAFEREIARFGSLLFESGFPFVFPAPSADVEPAGVGGGPFKALLEDHLPSWSPSNYSVPSESNAYATTIDGEVRLVVLDFSDGGIGAAQEKWLREQLALASSEGRPAVVMGSDALDFKLPQAEGEESKVEQANEHTAKTIREILLNGKAAAYLFDYPSNDVQTAIVKTEGARTESVPVYGTGTLGYVEVPQNSQRDSLGSSGVLLLNVSGGRASAEVVPNIGQLSLNAANGTLLRRSQVGLFEGLARRAQAGVRIGPANGKGTGQVIPDVYDPIPFDCQGANCSYEIPTQYAFHSSNPDKGGFVLHEPSSANPLQVELNSKQEPVSAEPELKNGQLQYVNGGADVLNTKKEPIPSGMVNRSGLFCAYNEGSTTVSIVSGGLSYSEPVRIQGGSVEYPCGTVPLKNPPAREQLVPTPLSAPSTPPAPAPVSPQPSLPIALPVPPPPVVQRAPAPPRPVPKPTATVPLIPPVAYAPLAFVPLPPPTVARPIPPSGTAPVTVPTTITQHEEEEEGAIEEVHNMAAYEHPDGAPLPVWPLGMIPIAALVAFSLWPRAGGQRPRIARAALEPRPPRHSR